MLILSRKFNESFIFDGHIMVKVVRLAVPRLNTALFTEPLPKPAASSPLNRSNHQQNRLSRLR
jgi:hypothetical protein